MDTKKMLDWFYLNYKPGTPHVKNAAVKKHYQEETGDYTFNQQEFPRALREAGLPLERTGGSLIIRGWTRKVVPDSFREFLLRHQWEDSPIGDLGRDFADDTEVGNASTYGELNDYFERIVVSDAAKMALYRAHREYQALVAKAGA